MSLSRCYADIDKRVVKEYLTAADAKILKKYLSEQAAIRSMADQSIITEYNSIIPWTKQLSLSTCSIDDVYRVRNTFKALKQNTQRTYIITGKRFFLWRFAKQKGICEKIKAIKTPGPDRMTKTASQMLTQETIDKIVRACRYPRDRAMLAMLYDGGFRPKEIITLEWGDIKVLPHGAIVNTNVKTGAPRRVLLVNSAGYLAQWRQDYPGTPEGKNLVFVHLDAPHRPFQYRGFRGLLKRALERAQLDPKITLYLFRHSHITAMQESGIPDGMNKLIHWGNQRTGMLATYAHISDSTMDEIILEHAGIKREQKVRGPAIRPIECPKCSIINPTGSLECYACGFPLKEDYVNPVQKELELVRLENQAIKMMFEKHFPQKKEDKT
ncbi:MAG: site-specific integrase [Methanoregula sp.]|jgi:integrase|nr:site-specific integrase [Methanoregula sp.]